MNKWTLTFFSALLFVGVASSDMETDYEGRVLEYLKEAECKRSASAFESFLAHLAFKESGNRPYIDNGIGYMGKYQFGVSALADIGIKMSVSRFRSGPDAFPEEMQDLAIRKWFDINRERLSAEIERYNGSIVNGIHITEAGILAASHLGGVWGVKKYFKNGYNPSDINGTSIESYLKEFSKFDITKRDVAMTTPLSVFTFHRWLAPACASDPLFSSQSTLRLHPASL